MSILELSKNIYLLTKWETGREMFGPRSWSASFAAGSFHSSFKPNNAILSIYPTIFFSIFTETKICIVQSKVSATNFILFFTRTVRCNIGVGVITFGRTCFAGKLCVNEENNKAQLFISNTSRSIEFKNWVCNRSSNSDVSKSFKKVFLLKSRRLFRS